MFKKSLILSAIFFFGLNINSYAQESHQYVGVKKCSICHKSAKKGNQYGKWMETKHAQSYKVLETEEAKKSCKR